MKRSHQLASLICLYLCLASSAFADRETDLNFLIHPRYLIEGGYQLSVKLLKGQDVRGTQHSKIDLHQGIDDNRYYALIKFAVISPVDIHFFDLDSLTDTELIQALQAEGTVTGTSESLVKKLNITASLGPIKLDNSTSLIYNSAHDFWLEAGIGDLSPEQAVELTRGFDPRLGRPNLVTYTTVIAEEVPSVIERTVISMRYHPTPDGRTLVIGYVMAKTGTSMSQRLISVGKSLIERAIVKNTTTTIKAYQRLSYDDFPY